MPKSDSFVVHQNSSENQPGHMYHTESKVGNRGIRLRLRKQSVNPPSEAEEINLLSTIREAITLEDKYSSKEVSGLLYGKFSNISGDPMHAIFDKRRSGQNPFELGNSIR
jgi:hypothetical protein